MTTPHTQADDVQAALGEYLAACERGLPTPRAEFLARHPGIEADLAAALDALEAVRAGAGEPHLNTLGEYQILGVAGRGGMGVVYDALQFDPPRRVALKVLAPALRHDPTARRRFRTEIQVAGRLHHTNVVPVLAAVPGDDGPVGYAMPYIGGESVAAAVRRAVGDASGPLADPRLRPRVAAEWVRQAAEAVAAAHLAGVTHRDVKPANLLVEVDRGGRSHVWLTDFGLAVVLDDGEEPPGDEKPVGSPGYMSPEQSAGSAAGYRPPTDVYALGVTLAELLTLAKPTAGGAPQMTRAVPQELRRVIAKATAADPPARYPTAAEMADDLGRYLAGFPVHAGRPKAVRAVALWAGRHRRALAASAAGFLVAVAIGAAFLIRAYSTERSARLAADEARQAADDARRAVATYTLAIDDALYANTGTLDTQRKLLEQAVEVHRRQLDREPADLVAARHLAQSQWRLGRVYTRLGRAADGVDQLRKSVDGYTRLADAEPGQHLHRLDLARAYSVLAWAARNLPQPDEVTQAHADAYRVMRSAVADFADSPESLDVRDAFASHAAEYGESLFLGGRAAEAEAVLGEALTAANSCRAARPDKVRYASAVVGGRMRLARVLAGQGRLTEALTENAAALELNAVLLAKASASADGLGRLDLVSFRMTRADLLCDRGPWLVAAGLPFETALGELTEVARVIATEHRDRVRSEASAIAFLRAWAPFRAGKSDPMACRPHEQALTGPANLVARSRHLADGPGERNPALAVELAREAVRTTPDDPHAVAALGLALYRNGQPADADMELARVADRPPHRSVGVVRAAITAMRGDVAGARRLLAATRDSAVPLEPCHPELEREAVGAVAAAGK